MAYKIIQSKHFLNRVIEINTYLETSWGIKVASSFHERLIEIILIIAEHTGLGSPSSKKKNVRKILITKHNRLYYRLNTDNSITLLILFDNRQNPNKNTYD